MREQDMAAERPERIKQKAIAPLKTDSEIRAEKAVCRFDYYIKDSRGKWLPRLYLCEHRTLADIFLESALFDPKKNVLCIPKTEWESTPEEAKQALRKFEKIFREPYQASHKFIRQLFRAREAGKSILLPATGDARGMDREVFPDAKSLVKLCRSLEMPVCTVTFRDERAAAERHSFYLDVRPVFTPENLKRISERETEAAIRTVFQKEEDSKNAEDFQERKRLRMREFLRSELCVEIPVDICRSDGEKEEERVSKSLLRADMTGITLETAGRSLHRRPGALKSLAIYPGKDTQTGERGLILVYPYFETVFYLFTAQKDGALDIQAAVEQMYEIVSGQ